MENKKKFEIYVFLSTFARNLIEVFIPIILYKFGYTLKEVILYFCMVNTFSLVLSYPCILLSKKYSNKYLAFIGIIAFIIVQALLSNMKYSYFYLIILSLFFATYRRSYWISRRFYNMKVISKEKISSTYSIISIINQLAVVLASYIGAMVLEFISTDILTIISITLFILSTIPLMLFKFEHEKNTYKIEFWKTIKQIPFRDIYLFGSHELIYILKFLFAFYLIIYVKNSYTTIGFFDLITNISVMIFSYIYGKKLDQKNNFLRASILCTVIVFLLKANITTYALVLISLLEGIFTKMYEISISKEFYLLSKKFEYNNYNLIYEVAQNSFRSIALLILLILNVNLKVMIYIVLLFMLIGVFCTFKQIDGKEYEHK